MFLLKHHITFSANPTAWEQMSIYKKLTISYLVAVVVFLLGIVSGLQAHPTSSATIPFFITCLDSPYVASYTTAPDPLDPFIRARRKPEAKGDFLSLTIPLKHAGNLLLVEAKAGDIEGNFILDFGAPYLVLNRTYFRYYEKVYGAIASDVTGASSNVYKTSLPRPDIRELYFEDIDADVADLGEIENRRGTQILGLLGVELFLGMEVTVDLLNDVLYLHRLDENGYRLEKNSLDQRTPALVEPITILDNTIVVEVVIATKTLRFALDSGAEVNVLDYGINRKVLQELTIDKRVTLHGAAGGQAEVLAGKLSEYSIGGRNFIGGKTIVANLAAMGKSSAGGGLDGMLGYTFFSQGIIRINFIRKELRWYPFVDENIRPKSE